MMPPIAILAGGLATRLYPVTKTIPKAMMEVDGKPFIEHQLELLKKNNISQVVLCTGYLGEQIKEYVGDGNRFGISVNYSFDGEKLLGTGGALLKALSLLGDVFWVMYGDSYLNTNFTPILDYFLTNEKPGLMTVFRNENYWDQSNIVYKNGRITCYDKKSTNPEMQYIDYGLALLRKEVFEDYQNDQVFDLVSVYQKLITSQLMLGYEVKERFYEIGSPNGLAETANYIKGLRR
jgi:MurNAc alpha-1-phosphate uridylyltransferase